MKELGSHNKTTWGLGVANKRMFQVWNGMKARCEQVNHSNYKNYGGRGIKVCERWQTFDNFLADMGTPEKGMSLDRIDHNGDYQPDNCRWASRREQSLNTRRSRMLEFNGVSKTAHEWAEELNIDPKTLRQRLYRGWSVEKTLTTPLKD